MANVTYTVNTTTRDMILKQYTTMTINSGDTVTVDDWCRGLFIYVQGNCTIDGTLSISSVACSGVSGGQNRGGTIDPSTNTSSSDSASVSSTGLRLPLVASGGTETLSAADFAGCGNAVVGAVANQPAISGNGKIFKIERMGGAGGAQYSRNGGPIGGNIGTAASVSGTTLTAAGGSSGQAAGYSGATRTSGTGGQGTCFGGGGGSGGTAGSVGHTSDDAVYAAGSTGYTSGSGWWGQTSGNGGMGAGTIILIVGGDLTIGASGSIQANGSGGGNGINGHVSDGGSGAGGNILICYAGTLTNNGSITASAGSGCGSSTAQDGAVLTQQITY